MESFDYLARHPDEAANFDEAMAGFTKHIASAVTAVAVDSALLDNSPTQCPFGVRAASSSVVARASAA